jgi:PIN domain nuclease of toxin-antitoxin system
MVVLDTAALIYWTLDPSELSLPARQAIADAEKVVVSSISIWEIALKVKRGKLLIPLEVVEYVEKLRLLDDLDILPVDVQTWLENVELAWDHRDPADRTIVATATRLSCPLVSSDTAIAAFYPETIW